MFRIKGAFKRDLLAVFPHLRVHSEINVLIVLQDAGFDLFNRSDNLLKDQCLENFFKISEMLTKELAGFWCDYIDPCSGLFMKSDCNSFFSDIDACSRLMKLSYVQCSGCIVLTHPKFGSRLYPSTFFTSAPYSLLSQKSSEIFTKFHSNL